MKAARFRYVRADSPGQALALLAREGPDARVMAGGQSLLATLALRLSEPPALVDVSGIAELRGVSVAGATLVIGALTRHVDVETSDLVARHAPLLAQALPHVAHAAIRNRGTIGGSIALADPAAEMPACMLALDAVMVIGSLSGSLGEGAVVERKVAAEDFFQGLYATAIEPGELLLRIEIPVAPATERSHFAEFARRHGDYAMVGLAARRPAPGDWRLVVFGCGDRARRVPATEALLRQGVVDIDRLREALRGEIEPQSDLNAKADTRLHLAAVLAKRAGNALSV